ncbi:MAG: hypothetical protein IKE89_02250 [Bacilli bacterium]|nr:hypothetical protein [Bacilli bacterium]
MNFGLSNVKIGTLDDKEIKSISYMEMETKSDQDFDYSFLNQSKELSATIETDLSVDLFSELEKNATESNFILGCDYGDGESKEVYFKAKLKHEITNIRKVRKGKRWIKKFNYTGNILMEGVINSE